MIKNRTPSTDQAPPPYEEVFGKVSSTTFQVAMATRNERTKAADEMSQDTTAVAANLNRAIIENDKDLILQILCDRNRTQRLELAKYYSVNYNKTISRHIEEVLNSKTAFAVLMSGLSLPVYKHMARMVHKSLHHCNWLNSVLFVLRNDERVNMKQYFKASMIHLFSNF